MASTSNNVTIQDSSIGLASRGDNNNIQVRDIIVNNKNSGTDYKTPDFKVPRCIESFYGREDKIKELDALFFSNKKRQIVLHGLPGFGKSELSKQYAKHCERKGRVQHTFWIEAEDEGKLKHSCQELRNKYDEYENVQCLYIFDNAVSRSSLFEYEPESDKHLTLITSVDGNWDGVVTVQLDSLPVKEAVKFLKTILNCAGDHNNEYFENLANAVSCVPLELQIVGGFVREEKMCLGNSFKLKDYVNKIQKSQFDVLHTEIPKSIPNSYKKTIYNAMAVSIDKIRKTNDNSAELALNILFVCAFADPNCIYDNDLLQIRTDLFKYYIRDNDDSGNNSGSDNILLNTFFNLTDDSKKLFKRALGILINLSFVTYKDRYTDFLTIHRLTQSFLIDYLESCNLVDKYFTYWLDTLFVSPFSLSLTVPSYCEQYSDRVHKFFKTQNSKLKRKQILEKLTLYECLVCLNKIFTDSTDNLIELIFSCLSKLTNKGQLKFIEFVLKYININDTNVEGDTVLHIIAKTGNIESIYILIERGANISARNNAGDTPLFVLAKCLHYFENVDWGSILKIFQFKNNVTNNNNEALLHAAAIGVQPILAEELIFNHIIDINHIDLTNRTPIDYLFLDYKVFYLNNDKKVYSTFKVLCKHGAKFNVESRDEECTFKILSSVIENDDLELLKCALQLGCDVHCRNGRNKTLLHSAAARVNTRIIQFFIGKGLNVNSVDLFGETAAFDLVRIVGMYKISKMNVLEKTLDLLNCQEQTQISNIFGNNMLQIAAENAHKDLVQLLIRRYKFNVNQQNNEGHTPLHALISMLYSSSNKKNVIKIVKTLKQAGADLNIANKNQETSVQLLHRLNKEENYDNSFLIPHLTNPSTCNVL